MKDEAAQTAIANKCDEIKALLLAKNKSYGNSATAPLMVFSHISAKERIRAQIDHKLSRLSRGNLEALNDAGLENESEIDTIMDFIGYGILLLIEIEDETYPATEPAVSFKVPIPAGCPNPKGYEVDAMTDISQQAFIDSLVKQGQLPKDLDAQVDRWNLERQRRVQEMLDNQRKAPRQIRIDPHRVLVVNPSDPDFKPHIKEVTRSSVDEESGLVREDKNRATFSNLLAFLSEPLTPAEPDAMFMNFVEDHPSEPEVLSGYYDEESGMFKLDCEGMEDINVIEQKTVEPFDESELKKSAVKVALSNYDKVSAAVRNLQGTSGAPIPNMFGIANTAPPEIVVCYGRMMKGRDIEDSLQGKVTSLPFSAANPEVFFEQLAISMDLLAGSVLDVEAAKWAWFGVVANTDTGQVVGIRWGKDAPNPLKE